MSYIIQRTSGTNPIIIADGTTNTSTSVTLVGKNYPNYGAILDQNFITLLENSANLSAPNRPITGQLWWDTSASKLQVYNGSSWKNIGSTYAGATPPTTGNVEGDLWWDTVNKQLWAYATSTSSYSTLIGPVGGSAGITSESITDSGGTPHAVLSFSINGSRYLILSSDASFTPGTPISGFQTIAPGLNLASAAFLTNAKFIGQVSDSLKLNSLYSNAFMRADTNTSTTGILSVVNNAGINIGTASNFKLTAAAPNVAISNFTSGGLMKFYTTTGSGTQINAMDIYPNGNVVANFDFMIVGNISFGASNNDLIINSTSPSINTATGALRVRYGGLGVAGNINAGGSQSNFVGALTAGAITSNSSVSGTTLGGALVTNAQPYVTSVGTLSTLTVSGPTTFNGGVGGITLTNSQPYITSVGTLTGLTVSGTTNLGNVSGVRITGGTSGQFLKTDGTGTLTWSDAIVSGPDNSVGVYTNGILTGNASLAYNGSTLSVAGSIIATGDITAFSTSDIRLKKDIENLTGALDKVDQLRGVSYAWNEFGINSFDIEFVPQILQNREIGVIAQDVQAVLPEVVVERTNGYLAVRYERIIPLLIEAIKELRAEVKTLKAAKPPKSGTI